MTRPCVHIVDDDPDIRDGLVWLFDSRGFKSASWDGGPSFLDGARALDGNWGAAVVLLDMRMAPLSGTVTFERLRTLGCPWPVLFLTGWLRGHQSARRNRYGVRSQCRRRFDRKALG